ncbi:PAAR domain-containing protein [Pseudomonas sp. EL_65y_Pfl2_R95]|uniref:PAAR domain-containing protein n=1 Tax=Pseudomonas sp. EL_65y_Pfl2_R95 TaxID=3088698 RepID=UPI0030DD0B7E
MSGKPAARISDMTACSGHNKNPIIEGSSDVIFDGLGAARLGDKTACGSAISSATVSSVLINGKPAAVLGSTASHNNNPIVTGSGTVVIGNSPTPAEFSPVAVLTLGAASALTNVLVPKAQAGDDVLAYQLKLNSAGNIVLTPLETPDFSELASGTTANSEVIDFLITNRQEPADRLTLEVLDGSTLLFSETNTQALLPKGEHVWQWDGYSTDGVLDTRILKSPNLKIRLTATKGAQQQIEELPFANSANESAWVDTRIDRMAKTVEITVRPSFSDGGVLGKDSTLTAKSFSQLQNLAKAGIELYWSRNDSRAQGIGAAIQTNQGPFKVTVTATVNAEPSAKNFPLISSVDTDFGRSTSFAMFKKIYHNQGFWRAANYPSKFADQDFEHTAAHEFGHLILNNYGDGGLIPDYSWSHKHTSTVLTQSPVENNPTPTAGEVDVMHYHSNYPQGPSGYEDFWQRSVASEQDVKGLIWLSRVHFND